MSSNSAPPAFQAKKPLTSQALRLVVMLVTLPYHRFFLYNTLRPAEIIERFAPHGTEDGSTDREKLYKLLTNWRARKSGELNFISIAGVAETAIVTATLSWGTIENSYWVGIGFFYASLIMSIIGMLLAAQQTTLLTLLGEFPDDWRKTKRKFIEGYLTQLLTEDNKAKQHVDSEGNHAHPVDRQHLTRCWRLSWQMIFVWQIPMMAVGYSFLCYIVGLTVLICTPLIKEEWGDNSKIAISYIAVSAFSWGIFVYCSLFGYRNVSLDNENAFGEEDDEEGETETTSVEVRREEISRVGEKVA